MSVRKPFLNTFIVEKLVLLLHCIITNVFADSSSSDDSHRGNWSPRIKHCCSRVFFHIKGKCFSDLASTGFYFLMYIMHVQCNLSCVIQQL